MDEPLDDPVHRVVVEGLGINMVLGADGFTTAVDVTVHVPTGETYSGTFFTFQQVDSIMQAHAGSGESLAGTYFWAADSIVVRELNQDVIVSVVLDLWKDGQLPSAMSLDLYEEPTAE